MGLVVEPATVLAVEENADHCGEREDMDCSVAEAGKCLRVVELPDQVEVESSETEVAPAAGTVGAVEVAEAAEKVAVADGIEVVGMVVVVVVVENAVVVVAMSVVEFVVVINEVDDVVEVVVVVYKVTE